MQESGTKKACDRCGTCCVKGGPSLHSEDLPLLESSRLRPEHLVTIRRGEPVFSLGGEKPEPAASEIIKLKGSGTEWICLFFQKKNAECTIYQNRPLECSRLKCWDTADLEKIAGRNLLRRSDLMAPGNPVLSYIATHEEKCSLENLDHLLVSVKNRDSQKESLEELSLLVNMDLAIRSQACERLRLNVDLELFCFGRPLFKILEEFSICLQEESGRCTLALSAAASTFSPE
jgi:Fe-S-cluster containining protein